MWWISKLIIIQYMVKANHEKWETKYVIIKKNLIKLYLLLRKYFVITVKFCQFTLVQFWSKAIDE